MMTVILGLCAITNAQASSPANTSNLVGTEQNQGKLVSGTVTDQNGEPLFGVAVAIEGTSKGLITDFDGNFRIEVPGENSVLIFSFVGFETQKITVGNQTTFNVVLAENVQQVDEVVVTALGIKKQAKALGYAMTELNGDDINVNAINPVNALQGKAAGVDIAQSDGGMFGSTKVLIRGASTLGSNNQPIYVVDGIILDNSVADSGDADWSSASDDWGNELKNLNPDDFASVSILKGAPATALYGSRGLNGAIVITTKSGKAQKGLGVSVSQTFGIDHVYKQPDLQNVYGDGALSGWVDYGDTYIGENGKPQYYAWQNQEQFYYNVDGQRKFNRWEMGFGPRFDGSAILGYDNEMTSYSAVKNNYRDMFDLGFNTNTNVAVQGGNEKTTFYSSVSYKHANGTLGKNEFSRLAFLAKATHKLADNVSVEASMNFAESTPKNPLPNVGEYFINGTFDREYDPSYYKNKYKGSHGGLASSNYGDEYANIPGRGLWWALNENSSVQHETSVRPYLALTIDATSWLKIKAEANYNYYFTDKEVKNPNSGYARTYETGAGSYSMTQTTKKQTNADIAFMFNKTINDDWSVTGFLRGDYYDNKQSYMGTWTSGGLVVPDQYFINNSVKSVGYSSYLLGKKRMLSLAAQASVAWKNQIFLDVTGRNDWSSSLVYSDGSGNYSYFYPSVSLAGIVTEMTDLPDWISFGKVRASWGQVGNDTESYLINSAYSLATSEVDGQKVNSLTIPTTMYSRDLKPEKKTSWELGLDWRFLGSRLGIDATYYKENTRNQIMSISVPNVSGVNNQLVNAGNIQNQGIEIALHTIPVKSNDWQWDVDFTYTKNSSKIISLHENVANYILLDGNTNYGNYRIGAVAKVGGAYGLLMTDSKAKIDEATGLPVLSWNDTRRTAYQERSGKEEEIGSVMPDFLGSVSTKLRYKNFSMQVGLDMRFGGYVASYGSRYGTAYGYTEASLNGSAPEYGGVSWTSKFDDITYSDGIIPEGIFAAGTAISQANGTSYTVAEGGETYRDLYEKGVIEPNHASAWNYYINSWGRGVVNDDWVKELDYIALREVSFFYNCPKEIAQKIGAGSLTFGLSGRNLGYLLNTAPGGENPESVRGTSAYNFRMRSYSPYTASYMFSISATF
ncbi:iron complex outermembrane receptor protein [Mangrovibacterium marinum]|uniref:Iron complex outermembrane receptor protein n=2 Tax=Mangrovibacterium marinum TaxID=1639118 RepID=A0A2T5C546_9BACT|nr:iron complex outermembrane receptor protein [Mangrovibacterium marinum]